MGSIVRGILGHWQSPVLLAFAVLFVLRLRQNVEWTACIAYLSMLTGFLLNAAVIAANRGLMPANVETHLIPDEQRDRYKPFDVDTRLGFLGDWISIRGWLISPGDVLLAAGVMGAILDRIR